MVEKTKVIVSACLIGQNVKYNGGNNYNENVIAFLADKEVIPVCPEVLGGLPTPRAPGEIQDAVVRTAEGISIDEEYRRGAEMALEIAKKEGASIAVLQSRSPSCGVNQIYDGSFTGKRIEGSGIFARLLKENQIITIDAEDVKKY